MKKETALERFLRYVQIDTQSKHDSDTFPSTLKQFDLARMLQKELTDFGLVDIEVTDKCYVYATLPTNIKGSNPPAIGFIAHMDTSPDVSGENVKPQLIENYQGGDIKLPASDVVIRESENPSLKDCIGDTIVTTDGTTLLGADDKAGVAAIMTALQFFLDHPEVSRPNIKIAFTPDEEVGQGVRYFDIERFGAIAAYTVDGGMPGLLNKETFSADSATIEITGRDIHPGSAFEIMVNSIRAMGDLIALLPKNMAPETTKDREPFIHPHDLRGSVYKTTLKFLLRAFDESVLKEEKKMLEDIISKVKAAHPKVEISLTVSTSYRNMREVLDKNPKVTEHLWSAALAAGVKPAWQPIRGGTDGSGLSARGLPTPNIYNGGNNFHARTEWLSVRGLDTSVKTLVELAKVWAR